MDVINRLVCLSIFFTVPFDYTRHYLTHSHWCRDKMVAISQTTFTNAFSWIKSYEFRLRFHWSVFLRFWLAMLQHWFRWWLGPDLGTSYYPDQCFLVYWRIYRSLGLNKLINYFSNICQRSYQILALMASCVVNPTERLFSAQKACKLLRDFIISQVRLCFFHCYVISDLFIFFSPTPALSTISRPLSSSMCSITTETANVGSSYNRIRGPG